MKYFFLALGMCMGSTSLEAALRTEVVEYRHGDTVLEGYLAYDDSIKGKRPGILVVHEWMGHNPYVRKRAEQLASLGYTAFALDMYGKGVLAKSHEEAAKLAGIYRSDRQLMRARALAGFDVLKKSKFVDLSRLAAIGYCFGGATVLELVRSGADLKGVASFHGSLDTPNPQETKEIKAKILILHGADDGFISSESIAAFIQEMRAAKADWQMVQYGGAVHSFTVPSAGNDPSKGMAYNEKADKRSWSAMKTFFAEIF